MTARLLAWPTAACLLLFAAGCRRFEGVRLGPLPFVPVAAMACVVDRIRAELGGQARVIGTGGLAPVLAKETNVIEVVDQMLTLEGLRLIYELNQG